MKVERTVKKHTVRHVEYFSKVVQFCSRERVIIVGLARPVHFIPGMKRNGDTPEMMMTGTGMVNLESNLPRGRLGLELDEVPTQALRTASH